MATNVKQPAIPVLPEVLRKHGFTPVTAPGKRRLFTSSEGAPSSGKTHFISTMPGPVIAILDFDRGLEGVVDRQELVGDKLIVRKTLPMPDLDQSSKTMSAGEQTMAVQSYETFKKIVEEIIRSGQVRSLAIDNGGDPYTLAQMARFGRIAAVGEVPAQMWTMMQLEFEQIFRIAYDHSTNLHITHRHGSKYRGAMGEMELKGYKRMQYVSQVHLEHIKDKDGNLRIEVKKCRQRIALEDPNHPQHVHPIIFMDEDKTQSFGGTFLDIATAVFPNTKEEDWF